MKINFLLKGMLPFVMFTLLCIPTVSQAQDGDQEASARTSAVKLCGYNSSLEGAVPGCLDNTVPIHITGDNCTGPAPVRIYLTNVVRRPEFHVTYPIPSGPPKIYLEHEYDTNDWRITGPYEYCQYVGKDDNNSDIYAIVAQLETHRSSAVGCVPNIPEVGDFDLAVNIMAKNSNNEYYTYPIHQYSTNEDIFSCQVFMETACDCLPIPPPSCEEIVPEYLLKACLSCDCTGPNNPSGGDDIRSSNSYETANQNAMVVISPNPARDFININYTVLDAQQLNISILDVQGRLVHTSQYSAEAGKNSLEINTEKFDSGIYYLEIQAGKLSQTKKLVIID